MKTSGFLGHHCHGMGAAARSAGPQPAAPPAARIPNFRSVQASGMSIASPRDVFFDQLKDLESATGQAVQTLPELIDWAANERLRESLAGYFTATHRHLQLIQLIFNDHSMDSGNDLCKAMAGLIEGGNAHIALAATSKIRDQLLIAHCTRMGHYLEAAAHFTRGIAGKCKLTDEQVALAEIAQSHVAFVSSLADVSATVFDIKIGGGR